MSKFKERKETGELVNFPGFFRDPTVYSGMRKLSHVERELFVTERGDGDGEDIIYAPTHLLCGFGEMSLDPSAVDSAALVVIPGKGVYPYHVEPQRGTGYTITFPDVPEAISQADTEESIHEMAVDALLTAFSFYIERGQPIPESKPLPPLEKVRYVKLSVATQLKIKLLVGLGYDEDDENNIVRCARLLGISRDAMYYHIGDLHQTTGIARLTSMVEKVGIAP